MTKSLIATLLALCLATSAPALAQQSIPQLGIDKSGSCRNFSIYDPTKPGSDKMVPIACINTTTHAIELPVARVTGLGTAATATIGTSGGTVPLLSGANVWSAAQIFSTTVNLTPASGAAIFYVNAPASGQTAYLGFRTGAVERWRVSKTGGTEAGGNAGSDFALTRYDDAGSSLGAAIQVTRQTGDISLGGKTQPATDNSYALGGASNRWSNIYGAIVTTASLQATGGSATGLTALGVSHPSAAAIASVDSIAGQSALYSLRTSGLERWRIMKSNAAEAGADAGSDLMVTRYSDAGTFLGTALTIARADGTTTVAGNVVADANNMRNLGSSAAYWQRAYIRNPVLGFRTVTGDANFTMTVGAEPYETLHSGTITADRTCTLSTTGAVSGDRFKLVRSGGGAFNISFGGLKNLAQNTWAIATYNGSAWVLTGYGTL